MSNTSTTICFAGAEATACTGKRHVFDIEAQGPSAVNQDGVCGLLKLVTLRYTSDLRLGAQFNFAFRYDGIDIHGLAKLFSRIETPEIESITRSKTTGGLARRPGYFRMVEASGGAVLTRAFTHMDVSSCFHTRSLDIVFSHTLPYLRLVRTLW
jgi:hypothetical protein